jgi:hypothetical protein
MNKDKVFNWIRTAVTLIVLVLFIIWHSPLYIVVMWIVMFIASVIQLIVKNKQIIKTTNISTVIILGCIFILSLVLSSFCQLYEK